jgi:HEAT repeat protein
LPSLEAAFRDVTAKRDEARAAALEVLGSVADADRDRAIVAVRTLIDDSSALVRIAALAATGRLRDEDSFDRVAARLSDTDRTVRQVALIALSELGGPRALEIALVTVESDSPEMRFQAIAALAVLAPERAHEWIHPKLLDEDAHVRAHAAEVLGSLGDHPKTREALARCLEDQDREPRIEAAIALATMGDRRALPHLHRLLEDPTRALVAAEHVGALGALIGTVPNAIRDDLARIAHAFLKPLMLQAAASVALVRLGDDRGIEGLRRVLGAWRADGRTYAVVAIGEHRMEALIPELIALSVRPRGADPVAIAEALGQFTNASARDALSRMARSDNEAGLRARELISP